MGKGAFLVERKLGTESLLDIRHLCQGHTEGTGILCTVGVLVSAVGI